MSSSPEHPLTPGATSWLTDLCASSHRGGAMSRQPGPGALGHSQALPWACQATDIAQLCPRG